MLDSRRLVSTLLLTTSLALLASVLAAPIRTSGFIAVSSRPDFLRRNFALPLGESASRLVLAMASDAVLEMNALACENEEQERADALDDSRISFLNPCSFPKNRDLSWIAPRPILSLFPLRC